MMITDNKCKRKKQHQQPATPPALLFYLNCTSQNLLFFCKLGFFSILTLPCSYLVGSRFVPLHDVRHINQIAPMRMNNVYTIIT